jgi:hypothetical protein
MATKKEEIKVKTKAFLKKTLLAGLITLTQVIIPSIIIMEALVLLGFAINLQTFISSAALYFIIEEAKNFIKQIKKDDKK